MEQSRAGVLGGERMKQQYVIEKCGVPADKRYLQEPGETDPVFADYATAWRFGEVEADTEALRMDREVGLYAYATPVRRATI